MNAICPACPECRSFAVRMDERQSDGDYAPGSSYRCVNCKHEFGLPPDAAKASAETNARERLQAIIDWADIALANPNEFNAHGVKNLDGPVFDAAREYLSASPVPTGEAEGRDVDEDRAVDFAEVLIRAVGPTVAKLGYTLPISVWSAISDAALSALPAQGEPVEWDWVPIDPASLPDPKSGPFLCINNIKSRAAHGALRGVWVTHIFHKASPPWDSVGTGICAYISGNNEELAHGITHYKPVEPRFASPPQPDAERMAATWHKTAETICTMLGLSCAGSPEEMFADVQTYLAADAERIEAEEELREALKRVTDHLQTWAGDHVDGLTADIAAAIYCARLALRKGEQS